MNQLHNLKYIMEKFGIRKAATYDSNLFKSLSLIEEDKFKLLKDIDNEILFRLFVSNDFCNIQNTMHGGAISTLIDLTTTIAISGMDRNLRHNVSVELSTYFLNPIKNNSSIIIHCKIPKIGKSLAYSYTDIYDEESLKLCANGSHVKAMLDKTWRE
jgi:uncharacterized protein (TIGR00369 family)